MTTVLVTRPRHQQDRFITLCQALGVSTVSLPLLKIVEHLVAASVWQPKFNDKNTAWIFTSKNAVLHCPFSESPTGPVFAMGASTAQALKNVGHTLAAVPDTPFNSEALINQLKTANASSAVVVTGIGGRAYLAKELRSMHWTVTEIPCYERIPEELDIAKVQNAIAACDILSLTSIESMDVLLDKAQNIKTAWKSKPIIVNSERAVPAARDAGFTGKIVVAVPAGDDGQIVALKTLL